MSSIQMREITRDSLEAMSGLMPEPASVDATIEVLDESFGDQIQAQRLPWHALIYDASNDVLELSVGGRDGRVPVVLRHSIQHPTRVWVEEVDGAIRAVSIETDGGTQTIVRFHHRAALGSGGPSPVNREGH